MTVRIRGIYTTALTAIFDDVVQASPPIDRRFERSFPADPPTAIIETTPDRQGVGVFGTEDRVDDIVDHLDGLAIDAFVWDASLPRGAVFAGKVTDTLGSGAIVDCGPCSGFLPYSKTARRVEEGDCLRVQVDEPRPPWVDGRPVLETAVRIHGGLGSLIRGGDASSTGGPELADILPADPPAGWVVSWGYDAEDADLDALTATIDHLSERAQALDDALADAEPPGDVAPESYYAGDATRWIWFGREARFVLDEHRRKVVATMPGHHRIKAGTAAASDAVDFVERVCDQAGAGDEEVTDEQFPFPAVITQFGPTDGDSVSIGHGKPDGRRIELGTGTVTDWDADGTVTVERELSGGGTYDALGVPIEDGDVARTTFTEGRWWYPTVYRGEDGTHRGTYVNICTPVEIFPDEVRYVDLYIDVIKHPDGRVEQVDEAELAAAEDDGTLAGALAEKARAVATAVENAF
jgi:hypothetical protein